MSGLDIEGVLAAHQLDPRPGITPGGNPLCLCGWTGLGHIRHVAAAVRDHLTAVLADAGVRDRCEIAARRGAHDTHDARTRAATGHRPTRCLAWCARCWVGWASDDPTTIAEKCGCGAQITVTDRWSIDARRAVTEWREGHRCTNEGGFA